MGALYGFFLGLLYRWHPVAAVIATISGFASTAMALAIRPHDHPPSALGGIIGYILAASLRSYVAWKNER